MLAARIDQENLVHEQQTAAASKPLNQNIRGLHAKTPGNKAPKTPFKVPLNDENSRFNEEKSVLKTNIKGFNKAAFVTPAGPKTRTALGNKTTNAKANAFATPGNLSLKAQKSGSPRLRRPKLKVLNLEATKLEEDEDILDVEYMPPKPIPLQDDFSDDEFGPNKNFPQLAPENLTKGWSKVYLSQTDDDGLTISERESFERLKRYDDENLRQQDKQAENLIAETEEEIRKELGLPAKRVIVKKTTANSRSIARPTKPSSTSLNVQKIRQPKTASQRFASATAASKNTLGYAHGRAVSQHVRKPVAAIFRDDQGTGRRSSASDNQIMNQAAEAVGKMRMNDTTTISDDGHVDLLFENASGNDDEFDDFQLQLPE